MSEMILRVAAILKTARGCDEPESAASAAGFPCPFCRWPEDTKEESGCLVWAEKIVGALREPTPAMLAGFICKEGAITVWREMVDAALLTEGE